MISLWKVRWKLDGHLSSQETWHAELSELSLKGRCGPSSQYWTRSPWSRTLWRIQPDSSLIKHTLCFDENPFARDIQSVAQEYTYSLVLHLCCCSCLQSLMLRQSQPRHVVLALLDQVTLLRLYSSVYCGKLWAGIRWVIARSLSSSGQVGTFGLRLKVSNSRPGRGTWLLPARHLWVHRPTSSGTWLYVF